jgi:hypothetical protein
MRKSDRQSGATWEPRPMNRDVIEDFLEKRTLDTLREGIDRRLAKIFAGVKCLDSLDAQQCERWRSVSTTTMWIPSQIDDRIGSWPKDWLTLGELGQLLDSCSASLVSSHMLKL